MKLHECHAKRIMLAYGIAVPEGAVAYSPGEAHDVAEQLGGRVLVKAQVLASGRGRAGGIRLVNDPEEAENAAEEILNSSIAGMPICRVLVERAVDIVRECYFGLAVLPSGEISLTIAQETAPFSHPPVNITIDPIIGLLPFQVRVLAAGIGLGRRVTDRFVQIGLAIWRSFIASDALRLEINPLALTPSEDLVALDVKMAVDENAFYRHPELSDSRQNDERNHQEEEANRQGMMYVRLPGNIGSLVNGAGLAMATSDLLATMGGKPANIFDVGGGARAKRITAGMSLLLADERISAILVNIFGGITRCDEVATGILTAIENNPPHCPIFVRLTGTNEHQGRELLKNAPVTLVPDMLTGARAAVAAGGKE